MLVTITDPNRIRPVRALRWHPGDHAAALQSLADGLESGELLPCEAVVLAFSVGQQTAPKPKRRPAEWLSVGVSVFLIATWLAGVWPR
jgi:hypothetical protein